MLDTVYFEAYTKVKFEGIDVPIFAEYDKCLTVLYGDYMTPPPLEEQVGAHDIAHLKINMENENE